MENYTSLQWRRHKVARLFFSLFRDVFSECSNALHVCDMLNVVIKTEVYLNLVCFDYSFVLNIYDYMLMIGTIRSTCPWLR